MTFPMAIFRPRVPATISLTDHAVDTSDASTYTFTSKAIGSASANRLIIIGVSGVNTTAPRTISSLTVGGVSATQVSIQHTNDGVAWLDIAFYAIRVDTGTTATVVVNWSAGQFRTGIGVWAAYGVDSATATATGTSTASPLAASLTIGSGGVAVGYSNAYGGTPPTYTWANLTEDFDETTESPSSHTGASLASIAGVTATVTCTPSVFITGQFILAAFR